jgi:hypothetical protein
MFKTKNIKDITQLENTSYKFNQLYKKYNLHKDISNKRMSFSDRLEQDTLIQSDGYKYARELTELIRVDFEKIKKKALEIIELFEENKKEFYKKQIDSLDIEKIQKKKYINVKEFTEIYGKSSDWQKNRRSRIHDNLPYYQTTNGGKITYKVEEIDNWFENNNVGR